MPKPTEIPFFATRDSYAIGPDTGQPTKLPYDAQRQDNGHIASLDFPPVAQYENFRGNLIAQWCQYIGELFTFAQMSLVQAEVGGDAEFGLTLAAQEGGYSLDIIGAGSGIVVPEPGVYQISINIRGDWQGAETGAPLDVELGVGNLYFQLFSTLLNDNVVLNPIWNATIVARIEAPATEQIIIRNRGVPVTPTALNQSLIAVRRVA